MLELLTPGVFRQRDDRPSRGIPAVRTDICGIVGIAERGPLNRAVACESWEQFEATFGTFIAGGYLAYAAKAFFENGGRTLVAVRVAAPGVEAASAGVQPADGASSVLDRARGFAPRAVVTITQEPVVATAGAQPAGGRASVVGTLAGFTQGSLVLLEQAIPSPARALRRVAAAEAPATLWWDEPIDAAFDLTSPITLTALRREERRARAVDVLASTVEWESSLAGFALGPGAPPLSFATGAGAASVVLFDERARPTLRVDASSPGTWGNRLAVRVTRSARAAAVARAGVQPAGGAGSVCASVTGLGAGTLVRLFQDGAMGEAFRIVTAVDPITSLVSWDAVLPPAYDPTKDLSVETVEFGIVALLDGRVREVHDGLSLDARHERWAPRALGASRLLTVHDLASPSSYRERLPDPRSRALQDGFTSLHGGRDGLAALRPVQLTGRSFDAEKRGVRLFEDEPDVSQLVVPDACITPVPQRTSLPLPPPAVDECLPHEPQPPVAVPPPILTELPPSFDEEDVFFVQEQLIEHCRRMGDRVALLDPPHRLGTETEDVGDVEAWRARFDSPYAALFFPWVAVLDPLRGAVDPIRVVPPSAHVAGVIARVDRAVGVHKSPGNEEVLWAQALAVPVTTTDQEQLHPRGIDCIRALPGRGIRLYGASTTSSDLSWRDLNVRRLMNMLKRALAIGTQWAVFEPNGVLLRERIGFAIVGFLESLWERGALVGATREEAFGVRALDDPDQVEAGRAVFEVRFAPARPAEYVVLYVGRTEDQLRVTEEI